MKSLIIILVSLVLLTSVAWAGDKDELQLKARALIAEANLAQSNAQLWGMKFNEAQKAIQEFVKEIDAKGFTVQQDGTIAEKPKPAPAPSKKEGDKK